MDSLFAYWGKTRREGDGWSWHPLVYHCLDVAAVGRAWLVAHPQAWAWLSAQLGWSPQKTLRVCGFLLALHDLGKFADNFQGLAAAVQQQLQGRVCRYGGERHDALGYALLTEEITALAQQRGWLAGLGLGGDGWWELAAAVSCHHGRPTARQAAISRKSFRPEDRAVARSFVVAMAELFELESEAPVEEVK